MTEDPTVTRNAEASRYEIRLGRTLAGFSEYRERHGEVQFTHTEVDPAFRGKGLAPVLVSHALADATASGATIVPYCPYVARYIKENEPEGTRVRWPQLPEDPTAPSAK